MSDDRTSHVDRVRFTGMNGPASSLRPFVVCPLEFERQLLKRAGIGAHCELHCCGPGSARIEDWARKRGPTNRPVVLAGLAGGLSARALSGHAGVIREVIDSRTKQRWQPSLAPDSSATAIAWSITSSDHSIDSADGKAEFALRTTADLVDLESVGFAKAASALGWNWAIVRGVSDDFKSALPPSIDQWVDQSGHPRLGVVLRALVSQPGLIPVVWNLRRRSSAAMQGVATLLKNLLRDWEQSPKYKQAIS